MSEVLYLCFAFSKENNGFVYPGEIDDENYYAPGLFIIQGKAYYQLDDKYGFQAVQKEEIYNYTLEKVRKNIFRVRVEPNIDLYFKAKFISSSYNHYLGGRKNRISPKSFFYELIPMQPNRIEELCQTKDFYFVGIVE